MVNIRPLSTAEAATLFPKRGQLDISEYVDAIASLRPGEAAEVEIDGHTPRAIKRRFGMAARAAGVAIKWARAYEGDDVMVFQIKPTPAMRAPRKPRTRQLVTA